MIQYLPQVKVPPDQSSLQWQGVSENGSTSFWRLDKQKVTNWAEAIERINKYPDLPARVIVIFRNGFTPRNGQYWLTCNIVDEISETLKGSKNA